MPLSESQLKRMETQFSKALECKCKVCERNLELLVGNQHSSFVDWQAVMQKREQDGLAQLQCLYGLVKGQIRNMYAVTRSCFGGLTEDDISVAARLHTRVILRNLRETIDTELAKVED